MADDPAEQAIGVIGVLREAGLLATAPSTAEPVAQIIGALREAGLLRTGVPSTAEPPVVPQIGDNVRVPFIRGVSKRIDASKTQVRLTHSPVQERTITHYLDFPPNDHEWLSEFDKIIAAPKSGLYVHAYVDITDVLTTDMYRGKLTSLSIDSWWTVYH